MALAACAHGPEAYAYLDPGTGSILVQGLLAFLATVGAFFGTIRRYFRQWMATRFSRNPNAATDDTTPDP